MQVVYVIFIFIFYFLGRQYLRNYVKHILTKLCHNFNGNVSAERKEDLQSETVSALLLFSIIELSAVWGKLMDSIIAQPEIE